METIIYKDGDKYLLKNKNFLNYEIYIDLDNGNITNFHPSSSPCNRAIIRKNKKEIIKILDVISKFEFEFDIYWYSTVDDVTDINTLNKYYTKYLMQDIEHYLPKSIYLKLKREDTYCIRFDIDYNTVKGDKKDMVIKEDENDKIKGENNMKNSFKDLIKYQEIKVKMEWQTGQLVLDDEGHYFLNGAIMQTLPEMTSNIRAYIMSTPINSLRAGDIVFYKDEYVYINTIKDNKIKGIKLSGEEINFSVPTHTFLGNNLQMLPKVFSYFSTDWQGGNMIGGQGMFKFNPAMLYALDDDNSSGDDIMKQIMKFNMINNMSAMFGQNLNGFNVTKNVENAGQKVEAESARDVEENIETISKE